MFANHIIRKVPDKKLSGKITYGFQQSAKCYPRTEKNEEVFRFYG